MKIVITGSLGNISKPLTEILVQAGHELTVISSSADKAAAISDLGAQPAIGSVTDPSFLRHAFAGADAVYLMVPPYLGTENIRQLMDTVGRNYADAVRDAGIRKVVLLSSVGAHLDGGTGPIAGLYDTEQHLNRLPEVATKFLRAGFFYYNFFGNTDMIRQGGIIGANYPATAEMNLVHPRDIAVRAAEALQEPFSGKTIEYVISDKRTAGEVARVLGAATGKPGLPWVAFSDEDALQGMIAAGMSPAMAALYVEMGTAIRNGLLWEDMAGDLRYRSTKLEDFAEEFAAVFR